MTDKEQTADKRRHQIKEEVKDELMYFHFGGSDEKVFNATFSKTKEWKDKEWIKNLRTNFEATLEKHHIGIPIEILIGVEKNTAKAIFDDLDNIVITNKESWNKAKFLLHKKYCDEK